MQTVGKGVNSSARVRGAWGPAEQPRAGGCGRTGRARSRTNSLNNVIVLKYDLFQYNTFIKQEEEEEEREEEAEEEEENQLKKVIMQYISVIKDHVSLLCLLVSKHV